MSQGPTSIVYSDKYEDEFEIESRLLRPFLRGSNIKRYHILQPEHLVFYPYHLVENRTRHYAEEEISKKFPEAWKYLLRAKKDLSSRGSERMKYPIWYGLWNARDLRLLEAKKILVPTIAQKPSFAFDDKGEFFFLGSGAGGPGSYGITCASHSVDPRYLLGFLNSRVVESFISATSSVFHGGYFAYSQQYLLPIPIARSRASVPSDKSRHDKMVELVEQMLSLHKKLPAAKTEQEKTVIQRQIEATDKQIDELVYELYGLTEEEIKIVEAKT